MELIKRIASLIALIATICLLFYGASCFGHLIKQGAREKRTNDSLSIVKLKLEIELKKLEMKNFN